MLTINQLVTTLQKVSAAAGDLPVIFKAVEGDAETFLDSIKVAFSPTGDTAESKAVLSHTTQKPADTTPPAGSSETGNAPTGGTTGTPPITG
jgi:hypothetical protein